MVYARAGVVGEQRLAAAKKRRARGVSPLILPVVVDRMRSQGADAPRSPSGIRFRATRGTIAAWRRQLSGIIERVTFHNPDTGFAVLRVQARGRRGLVTVVGTVAQRRRRRVRRGDRRLGCRTATTASSSRPTSCAARRRTPSRASRSISAPAWSRASARTSPRKIVDVFGERTLAVIDESPAFLQEVKGIGPRRIQRIRESWQEQKAVRGIMVFLQSHGVGTARAVRIYKTYGDQAVELVRANPYRLATDIWGVGFKTADELAERLGIDRGLAAAAPAPPCATSCKSSASEGHVGYPGGRRHRRSTAELTGIDPADDRRRRRRARAAGRRRWCAKPGARGAVALPQAAVPGRAGRRPLAARACARAAIRCRPSTSRRPWPGSSRRWAWSWRRRSATPSARRRASKVLVVTGGPGVGKTTIVRGILEIFAATGLRCGLCAPTGRAAKRLTETTGREAKTIHRLLEFDPALGGFKRDADQPAGPRPAGRGRGVDGGRGADEPAAAGRAARGPAWCWSATWTSCPRSGRARCWPTSSPRGAVPVVRLTEIFRQAGPELDRARRPRRQPGRAARNRPRPARAISTSSRPTTPEAILERIVTMVRERIPARFGLDPFRDVQVLTPMNRSELGAHAT